MSKTLLLGGHLVCSSEAKKCEDIKLTCIGFDFILYKSINYWSWVIISINWAVVCKVLQLNTKSVFSYTFYCVY
jgi:hypothetical protein